ncbi:transmembrane protein 182 [Chelonoidis abingdonii]|uniref:transmembrane protein 182 n=1 Tax=Chelonoidis abingdonii TaxID=106734 RepID=UPI0013F26941|nr:transmembrane protein 182 [Chelonoidis abingdonii]
MKLSVGIFFGGFFGALGVLLFLVAFGTDYWLLATEVGRCSEGPNNTTEEKVTFHHEGFFWRCWFVADVEEETNNIWKFWYTNQSPSKNCTHAYLSPFPFIRDEHNSTSYDSAIIYRGIWTVLMLLGVITVLVASFFIICAAPFASHILYKAGGGIFITAGILFSLVVVMYVIWVQAMADLENYMNMKKIDCPDFVAYVHYGWSFILAPIGIFFALFAGMLFLLVGRTVQLRSDLSHI